MEEERVGRKTFMPVEYLTEEQEQRYGRYVGEPTPEQLARYFHLNDEDRGLIAQRRGDHNRLGFACQIGTLRFLGTFLSDPVNIPVGVIAYMASQLKIKNAQCIVRYAERVQTQQDHAQEILQHYGYKEFSDRQGGFALLRFLYARAWIGTERPSVLFDVATTWLIDKKVLLPGVTTLTRLISSVRERVAERFWQQVSHVVTPELRTDLEGLLAVTQIIKWPQRPLIDIRQYGFTLETSKPDFRSSLSKSVEAGEKPYERTLGKCTIGQQFLDFCTIGQ